MSRPTTRSKNKKHRNDDTEDTSSEIFRKINSTGGISEDDINQLYLIWKPVCNGCRINTKDSPNCFCGLIPPPNGFRKSGLWQRITDIVQALGPDPCMDLRASTKCPAGLTNLGATCYANSILQCLYMNKAFRMGFFSAEPELLKQHPVLNELSRLFAQLHSSKRASIDSAPFIKTLELDNGVQQDSHEFLTLLLSLLERFLNLSKVPKAKTVVQDMFRGIVSHVTRCSVCGKDSEASSKTEDFYELELNIIGLNNLVDSLDDYLSMEELHGENQYFCDSCGTRVDATRCIKLRTLPAVLTFQLKRYVFLHKTTTKKKITSMFNFPRRLDMGQRLCGTSHLGLLYDLSAILIHKGTAVDSGHYVAHIKEEYSGHWWEFDDEHVSKLGFHPFGEGRASSSAKPDVVMQQACSEPVGSVISMNHANATHVPSLDCNVADYTEMFSSSDAYMLMYRRINPNERGTAGTDCTVDMKDIDEKVVSGTNDDSLPFHLSKEIEDMNRWLDESCRDYRQKKERELQKIMEHRDEVKSILSEAPVSSVEDQFFWISTDWLRQWADNVTCSSIDNMAIQCLHGRVPVSKVGSLKRISVKSWNKLFSKYGGGPALHGREYCIDCLKEMARTAVSATDYRDRRAAMKLVAEEALAGKCPGNGNFYYVSRAWLLQWLRRRNVDVPCDADAGPTVSLTCPHGGLLPEQAAGAKRLLVPEALWDFFSECAMTVKPNDLCLPFPSDSETCAVCSIELTEVAFSEDRIRAAKMKQRQNHEKLYLGKGIVVSPGYKYYLLPSSWLSKWKVYVSSIGKNVSTAVEPESLDCIIDSLKCDKHSRLLVRPLELICKRGEFVQKASTIDGLTIVTETDWKLFCEEWEVSEEKGICAEVDFTDCATNKDIGSSSEMLVLEIRMDISNGEAGDALESGIKKPIIKTRPEICEDCIGERESSELMQKLNYCNEDIRVVLVRGKEAPRSVLEASGTVSEPDRRSSKRSRKASSGGSANLTVSATTSVYQLKMMIWESFGVVKENQKLHKGSMVIEDESATLADMSIFPGDVLWVTDTEIHENRDIAEELSEQMDLQRAEEGFRGTLLASNVLAQLFDTGKIEL